MCEICDNRKTLDLKQAETTKLARAIEATQLNFIVACQSKDLAAQASTRARYHELMDQLLDTHAITTELADSINLATIEAIFGDDVEESLHAQESSSKVH